MIQVKKWKENDNAKDSEFLPASINKSHLQIDLLVVDILRVFWRLPIEIFMAWFTNYLPR